MVDIKKFSYVVLCLTSFCCTSIDFKLKKKSIKHCVVDNFDLKYSSLSKTAFSFEYDTTLLTYQEYPTKSSFAKILDINNGMIQNELEFGFTEVQGISVVETNDIIKGFYNNFRNLDLDTLYISNSIKYGNVLCFKSTIAENQVVGYQGKYQGFVFIQRIDNIKLISKPCVIKILTTDLNYKNVEEYLQNSCFKDVWASFKYIK